MFALTGLFASLSIAAAATFSDGFSSGINPACWTVYQTTAGLYSVDATQGDVRLAKISTQHNPGGIQSVYAAVNMAALGGNIAGDFSAQINFTNAALGGALDQVEFHTSFADGSIFYDVYDNGYGLNAHVWNGGSANGVTAASSGAGTFVIARTGSTLSGYYNGSLLFSENNGSALTAISLALQNNNGSDDAISVTFDNFSLTAASVPSQLTNTCTWTGSVGSDWFNPNNWSPMGIPGPYDTVNIANGTISLTSPVAIGGQINWSGGTLQGSSLTILPNAVMNLLGANAHTLYAALTNAGTVNWPGTCDLQVVNYNGSYGYSGYIVNQAGAVWNIQSDQTINGSSAYGAVASFSNSGLLRKVSASGTSSINAPFYNNGAVDVQSGAVAFNGGGGAGTGTFNVVAGSGISFGADNGGSAFTGSGTYTINSGTVTAAGTVQNVVLSGGTLNGVNATIPSLTWSGGTLGGSVTLSGTASWTGGTVGSGASISTLANTVMNIFGSQTHVFYGGLTNAGTVNWSGACDLQVVNYNGVYSYGGYIVNQAGAVWNIQNDQTLQASSAYGGAASFSNAGVLRKTLATGTTTINAPFYNNGAVDVQSGAVAFNGGGGAGTGTFNVVAGSGIAFGSDGGGSAFTGGGMYTVNGGTVTVSGTMQNAVLAGGTLNGANSSITNLTWSGGTLGGSVTLSGTVNWTGGTIGGGAAISTLANAVLNISGSQTHVFYGGLTNAGTVNWSGACDLQVVNYNGNYGYSGDIVNLAGGVWNIQNDQTIQASSAYGGTPYFSNAGLVRKTTATGTTTINAVFYNNGAVDVQSGAVAFNGGGGAGTGTFNVVAGSGIAFGSDGGGSAFTGGGTYTVNGGTITVSGTMQNAALAGGTLNGAGISITNLTWSGGTLGGSVTLSGTVNWTGGAIGDGASITTLANAVLNISGSQTHVLYGALTNSGTVNWSGACDLQIVNYNGTYAHDGYIVNQAGGIWNIQNDQTLQASGAYGGTPYFSNAGLLRKTSATGTTIINAALYNSGVLDGQSGTITFGGGGSGDGQFIAEGGATLVFPTSYTGNSGATFSGDGTMRLSGGTFTANGQIDMASVVWEGATLTGTIAISQMCSWTSGSLSGGSVLTALPSAVMYIGGTQTHTLYGALTNEGTVNWSGACDLQIVNYNGNYSTAGAIINQAGAVWTALTDQTIQASGAYGGTPYFSNAGLFRKAAGAGTTTISAAFYNSGTLDVESGAVALGGSHALTGGAISLQITSSTNFSQLNLSGAAGLAGALNVSVSPGYTPAQSNSFPLVTYSSLSGAFTSVNVASWLNFQTNYDATQFRLTLGYPKSALGWLSLGYTSDGTYTIDPSGSGPFAITCLMSLSGGGWTELTADVANSALNTDTNSMRAYLYRQNGTSLYYRTPLSTLVWSWTSGQDLDGTYSYSGASGESNFQVTASAEHEAIGVGGSSGYGTTYKCGVLSSICLDSNNAQVQLCQDLPGIFSGPVCPCGVIVYIRENAGAPQPNAPIIISQPMSQVVLQGSNAQFAVTVGGALPLNYQWMSHGTNLLDNAHVSGSQTSTLRITNAQSADNGSYQVVVSNAFGSVTSALAKLTVSAAVTRTWTGAVDSDWFNGNNWSPVGVPGPFDTLYFSGGTINLTAPVAIYRQFNLSGGTLSGSPLTVEPGAVLNIGGGVWFKNALTNAGTVTWTGGDIYMTERGMVENLAGALWDIQCDRSLVNYYASAYFHNLGALQKSAGTGATSISLWLENAGTVAANQGTIVFNGGGVIESVFTAANGAGIQFSSGAFSYGVQPILSGPGSLQVNGGSLTLLTNPIPNLQMTGGTISLGANFQGGVITNLTLAGATLSGNFTVTGVFNCGGGVSGALEVANGAVLNWSGGTISGNITEDAGSTVNWSGGNADGPVTVGSGAVLSIAGGAWLRNALTNAGTVTWTSGDIYVTGAGLVENLAGALWDIQCDRSLVDYYASAYFHNLGTLQKSASAGTTSVTLFLENAGTVAVNQGTIAFSGGGVIESLFTATNGAGIQFASGAFSYGIPPTLSGLGSFQFNGGSLMLLTNPIPNLQMTGGTIDLGPNFQGGMITNLTLPGATLSGNFTVTGVFNCSGGVSGALEVAKGAILNWSGGTISGNITQDAGSTVNWSGGTATGPVMIGMGATLNIFGGVWFKNALTNAGTVTWTSGDIYVTGAGLVENLAGALWDIQCDRSLVNYYASAYFHNLGTLQKSASTGTTSISLYLENAATVSVNQGTIAFNGGGVIESLFTAASGAGIQFANGGFSYGIPPTLSGLGSFQLNGGNLTLLTNPIPNLQMTGGTINLGPNFQGGVITNLTLPGATLTGNITVTGVFNCGAGVSGALEVAKGATLNWSGGTISGSITEDAGSTANWSGGTATGPVMIGMGATLNIVGGVWLRNALTNAGAVTWMSGDIYLTGPAFVENLPGALWDIQCDRSLVNYYASAYFHNLGALQKSTSTGTTYISLFLENAGIVAGNQGAIAFNGGGAIESLFTAASGAGIQFASGAFSYSVPPALSGPGSFQFNGGSLTLLTNPIPNLQMTGGTISLGSNFQGGAITNLTLPGSTLSGNYIVTGVFNCGAGATGALEAANHAVVNWSGGTLSTSLNEDAGSTVNWSGGTASAPITVGIGAALNISGQTVWLRNALTNAGTVTWTSGDIYMTERGLVENLAGALWDMQCDRSLVDYYSSVANFHNLGTLQKSASSSTTYFSVPCANAGSLNLFSGEIAFNTANGYSQTGATLNFGIAGAELQVPLAVSGSLSLDGTLGARLLNGYTPMAGDSFQLIVAQTRVNSFNYLNLPSPGAGLAWQLNYGATGVSLSVVSVGATTAQITGFVKDNKGAGIPNIAVVAYNTNATTSLCLATNTDASGNYTLGVTNGVWRVSVQDLVPRGYSDVAQQDVVVNNGNQTANFVTQPYTGASYTITVAANPLNGGSATGGGVYLPGSLVTVGALANTNAMPFSFANWTENGITQSSGSSYAFPAQRSRNLVANFTLPQYAVSVSNNPPTAGSVSGAGNYVYSSNAVLIAQPAYGYNFASWTEGGNVVATTLTLATVVYTNHFFVANYAEANTSHAVTTATQPAGLATVAGAGLYTNGQTANFLAPQFVAKDPCLYLFQDYALSNSVVYASASFAKTFSTFDPTNLQYVAVYRQMNLIPRVAQVTANFNSPVPATASFVLAFQFDRSMDTNFTPQVLLTNRGPVQPTVPATGGSWASIAQSNDTYLAPPIALAGGMNGSNQVLISGAHDIYGAILVLTNVAAYNVDTTPPVLSAIAAAPATLSAVVTWNSDKPASSLVDYGSSAAYGASSTLDSQLVTAHSVTLYSLSPVTPYHYRVRSRDLAGNETVSGDNTFTTHSAPDLQVANLTVSGSLTSGNRVAILWTDTNSGAGATFADWYDQVTVSNATTGQTLWNTSVYYDSDVAGNLASRGSHNCQAGFTLPDGPAGSGALRIIVTVNAFANQFEANGSGAAYNNNTAAISVTSALGSYPDLQVANLGVTNAQTQSGGILGIRWNDTNSGQASVAGSFQDQIVVSNTTTGQTLVTGTLPYDALASGPIAAGNAANRLYTFRLPDGSAGAGSLHISVAVDAGDSVFEYNPNGTAENNNSGAIDVVSTVAAYPDLAATNIAAPANAAAGQSIMVVWTDLNVGNASATNSWSDQVFMSASPSVSGGQLLGTLQVTNPIPAGGALGLTQMVTAPPFVSGNQWIIVKANASGSFFETNTVNNSFVSTQPINIGATLSLALSRTSVSESAGANALTATVSRNGATTSALTVNLSSAFGTNMALAASVTISAGQQTAAFPIGVVDHFLAGGSVSESISASASGFPTATAPLNILFDDVATLALTLNTNAVPENAAAGVAFGTVTRNANFGDALTVTLSSDLPTALVAPATVTIPGGQASASFNLTPVNDNVVGDTRRVHVMAAATGLSPVSATIDVLNANSVNLSLQLANAAVTKGAANPATTGVVSRGVAVLAAQNVYLSVAGDSLLSVPNIVTIPANGASASFNVNVGDDNLATGPQAATLTAQVMTPLGNIMTNGQASIPLTVLDIHGATLAVSFAKTSVAKGASTTCTISRNSPPTNALAVNLAASLLSAVTMPATVTIPLNQTSASFTIGAIADQVQTGPRKITVTASAAGFNSGAADFSISDIYYPDLAPVSIIAPTDAATSQQITVSWVVVNNGLASATNSWYDYVYLTSDAMANDAALVGFETNPAPLAIGAAYTNQVSFYLPEAPANYWFMIVSDAGNAVTEISKANNTVFSSAPISVNAAYRAELTGAAPAVAPSGTPIVLTGRTFNPSNHSPVPFSSATIRILVNAARRVFNVVSDANGNFAYTFQPLSNEAGDYVAGADYPLVSTDSMTASFALLGMQAFPDNVTAQLVPNVPLTNQLVLSNLSDHALTGLTMSTPDLGGALQAQFTFTNTTLPGGGALTVGCVWQSPLTRAAQVSFTATARSVEGAQLSIPGKIAVMPLTAQLVANPGYLARGMLVGEQTLVSFDVVNSGGAASGDLTVQLPGSLPWMTLSSTAVIPSIPPGGRATVTLALNPPEDLALTLYKGNLALANNITGVSIAFQFRAVSDSTGDLLVTTTDDYTYYVTGGPKVTNATVTVRDAITTEVIAQTNSDANGIAFFSDLPDGPYTVDTTAPQHNPYRGSASIVTGATNTIEAFMSRQLVSYQWTVVPTEIADEYKIQLESVFETEVPVPNVVVEDPSVMFFVFPGRATQIDFRLRNEGLIAAQNVTLTPPEDPDYIITPLVQNVGVIPAQSEVSIPVTIELVSAPATNTTSKITKHRRTASVSQALCDCLKQLNLNVQFSYKCGANDNNKQTFGAFSPLCGPVDAQKCIEKIEKLEGTQTVSSFACNAISALLSCGIPLDPCAKLAINTVCGAVAGALSNPLAPAAGAVSGAASSGLGSLPGCVCAHLPNIPLPSFPPSNPDLSDVTYGSGGSFGFYSSGFPIITGFDIDTSCTNETPQPNVVRKVITTPAPLRLQAPIKTDSSGGVCAHVRLRIDQDVVLTRTAFAGTLEIDNGGSSSITGIQVALSFQDATNGAAADKFITEGPALTALSAVDGSGVIEAGATGSAVYTFIPTLDAAPGAPATFQIGGTLSYIDSGQQVIVPLLSAPITVYPEAKLDLVYFQQRDVYGDDPFTPEIEPSEPFTLGLIVKNVGAGKAHNFRITSGQPQIVDNEKGLLIDFSIIGTEVGDQPISPSLAATLGDIDPGGARQVVWDLISTLQGKFISFDATFQHVTDLGSVDTSLIDTVEIHELTHKVLANRDTDDGVPDFLVNDIDDPGHLPDTLFLSDGSSAPVGVITNVAVDGVVAAGHMQVQLTANVSNGWNYIQAPDPGAGYRLVRVVRSDGRVIALTNDAWTTDRSFPASTTSAVREHLIHLFDWAGTGSYTLFYRSPNTTAPAIVQFGPVTPFTQSAALSSVSIVFSEPIDTASFSSSALTLTRNGGANLVTGGSGISLALLNGSTYAILGLASVTGADGNYQLTFDASAINDLFGNPAGNVSASISWAKGNVPAVVQSIAPISPNPRKAPVATAAVTFSKAINPATFGYQALSLTLDGGPNLVNSSVSVTQQSPTDFVINGLGALTGAEGSYALTVNAAMVQDAGAAAGYGSQSVAWTMITTGPTIAALQPIATNPRNIVVRSLQVTFSEPIDASTFVYTNLTLTRDGGANLITSSVGASQVNPTTYEITNINWVQGYAGTYTFTVNAAGILDLAGNPGFGSTNESWTIVLGTPAAPTNLAIAPDLGISSHDGLTCSNSVTLSGTVGAANLRVEITDSTTGSYVGEAAVVGTNFTIPVKFTTVGSHQLQVQAVDAAGNVSALSFYSLFLDMVAPTALIEQAGTPRNSAVTDILVTFSKPIATNTVAAANFVLTLNAASPFTPAISFPASNQCLVSGIASFTAAPGAYELNLNLAGVQDRAGNIGSGVVSMAWQNGSSSQLPVITQLANIALPPNSQLRVTNSATDPGAHPLYFALGKGAPAGMSLTSAGVLSWTPSFAQGSSSNFITVWAVERAAPALSNSMSFAIVVGDCARVQVGSGFVMAGSSGSAPVNILATAPVTNLSFTLDFPTNRLVNWFVSPSNAAIGAIAVRNVSATQTVFTVGAKNGQSLVGSFVLGSLTFGATPGSSAFVPLTFDAFAATEANQNSVPTTLGEAGRIIILGPEPLLEAHLTNGVRSLVLYGIPGNSYQIQSSTNLRSRTNWINLARTPMTEFTTVIPNLSASAKGTFYRAYSFNAAPPIVDVLAGVGGRETFVLYGVPGLAYEVDDTTTLGFSWNLLTRIALTNSFQFFTGLPATNQSVFYRFGILSANPPIIEAHLLNSQPALLAYGLKGSNYEIQFSQKLTGAEPWTPLLTYTLTNSFQYFTNIGIARPSLFYRLHRQ